MTNKSDKQKIMEGLIELNRGSKFLPLSKLKKIYGAPLNNMGRNAKMAMDNALSERGHFNALQRDLSYSSESTYPQFLGYTFLSSLEQNGFIKAGVEGLADDMTESWIELVRTGNTDSEDDKIAKLSESLAEFNLRKVFNEASTLCGYFGGCLVFIDDGTRDPALLKSALDEKSLFGGLKRFTPIEPINVYPGIYNSSDPLEPDYFVPKTWWILGNEVHSSRLLYFTTGRLGVLLKPAYNFFGVSPAQIAVNSVQHFMKDRDSASRLLHKFSLTYFKTDTSSSMYGGDPSIVYNRIKMIADMRDNDSIIAIDKDEEDFAQINTSLSDVTNIVRLSLEQMPIMFRQPVTKFLGISPGGLNATGESDENNWNSYVLSQNEKILREPLKYALEILQYHLFGEEDKGIDFVFKKRSLRDEISKNNNNKIKAEIDSIYIDRGVLQGEEVRKRLQEDPNSGYNSIDTDYTPEDDSLESDYSEFEDIFSSDEEIDLDSLLDGDWEVVFDREFDESKINRKSNGQFGTGGSGKSNSSKSDDTPDKKIDSINIDFSKSNILPRLNKDTLEKLGVADKPVLLKKNIIDKNKSNHADVTEEEYKVIIGNCLYKPDQILLARKSNYRNLVRLICKDSSGKDKYGVVLLDLTKEKKNFEIVNFHWLNKHGVEKKKRNSQ